MTPGTLKREATSQSGLGLITNIAPGNPTVRGVAEESGETVFSRPGWVRADTLTIVGLHPNATM